MKKPTNRRLSLESLENRRLLAADVGHNFLMPLDVNDDRLVTPIDVLLVTNQLNSGSQSSDASDHSSPMVDVNDDSLVSPIDVLQIVNELNRTDAGESSSNSEFWLAGESGFRARIELNANSGGLEISIKLVGAEAATSYPISINNVVVAELSTDENGRGKLDVWRRDEQESWMDVESELDIVIGTLVQSRLAHATQSSDAETQEESGSSLDDERNIHADSEYGFRSDRDDDSRHGDDREDDHDDDTRHGGDRDDDDDHNSGHSHNDSSERLDETELEAKFPRVGGVKREAEYEVELEHGQMVRKFEVEIERAAPDAAYSVTVDGTHVATLTTNSRGKAKLKMSSQPREGREVLIPENFPQINLGTVVRIGDLESTFQLDD